MRPPRKILRTFTSALLIALAAPASARDDASKGMTAEDLVMLNRIANPQISSDGKDLVFVLRATDREANIGRTDLWHMPLTGKNRNLNRLTNHPESDISPRWSADGKQIYFLSGRSGNSQIWALPIEGGEARLITSLPVPVTALAVSPAGNALAFSADVFPDCPTMACNGARLKEVEEQQETGLAYDRLIMRFWDTWRDGRLQQLFVLPLNEEGIAASEAVNVSAPLMGDVPEKPFGTSDAFTFSPDGKQIFFSLKVQDRNESWSINSDIFVAQSDGGGEPENLTAGNKAGDANPIVSPDGKQLAWLATDGPQRWAAENLIRILDLESGNLRNLAPGWDRSPQKIVFSPDGQSILATADHMGTRALWRVPINGNAPSIKAAGGWIGSFAVDKRRIVFTKNDLSNPTDLFEVATSGKTAKVRRLTAVNSRHLDDVKTGDYKQFSFSGADGDDVYAFVVKPAGFEKSGKYPLALMIHGGPHGSMGDQFHHRWNAQVLAGAGYAVMMIDFHGSTGYGQKFVESIIEDRGGRTLTDHQLGLAAAIEKYDWIDGDRVCAIGGSFGGYMVSLIAGAWPDRFRCLVNHDGMFDNRMKYFAGDIIGYLEEGFGGTYFDNPEGHENFNPSTMVDKWQTPMLVIHGGRDYRVPETQGIGAFTALQRKGVPGRFLYFPDENHWVRKPANSVQWYREVIGWLDRWLKEGNPEEQENDN